MLFACQREKERERDQAHQNGQKDEYYALKVVLCPFSTKLTQLQLEIIKKMFSWLIEITEEKGHFLISKV